MKQQITKNAIETAFVKLLNERSFEKVMVKDIVEECGLTRNTFYYYYEDTYNIITDVLEREVKKIEEDMDKAKESGSVEQLEQTLTESTLDCFEFLDENHKLAKHLLDSCKKEEIYRYIGMAVEAVARHYVALVTEGKNVPKEYQADCVKVCKYVFKGMLEDWINKGMRYSLQDEVKSIEYTWNCLIRANEKI